MEETVPVKKEKQSPFSWLKKRILPLAGLLLSLAIMFTVAVVYVNHRDIIYKLEAWEYAGAFVISTFLCGTVILPVSNMGVIIALGAALPMPWLVGVAGGAGAAIGEMTGYLVGRSGRGMLARNKTYLRVEVWVKKWGWVAVFLLSIVSAGFDVVGLVAGALRMPVWKFMIASWLGRTIIYIAAAYVGDSLIQLLPWFS